jgi:SAM-dependent methyltransferase
MKRWDIATKHELSTWNTQKELFTSKSYLDSKKRYWDGIINGLPFKIQKNMQILEVGCGPMGITLVLKAGRIFGLDPLINEFRKNFKIPPYYKYIPKKIEDYKTDEKFDVIFAMQVLDHVDDIKKTAKVTESLLKECGFLVVEMRCSNHTPIKHYFNIFGRFIDPNHPHHPKKIDVIKLFSKLKIVEMKINKNYKYYLYDTPKTTRRKLKISPILIFNLFPFLFKKMGFKHDSYDEKDKSLFSFVSFVFQKRGDTK